FGTATNYYARCSSRQFLPRVRVPTLILSAQDDPLVPARLFDDLSDAPAVTVHVSRHGGHLGFIAGRGDDPDRRWMDWRIIDWMTAGDRAGFDALPAAIARQLLDRAKRQALRGQSTSRSASKTGPSTQVRR
ncbi:MAG: alpha/beta fold hydrolase, partial [Planctomycetaceae bacterium]